MLKLNATFDSIVYSTVDATVTPVCRDKLLTLPTQFVAAVTVFNVLGVLSDILVLFSLQITPSLQGFTKWLLVNELVSGILTQVTFISVNLVPDHSLSTFTICVSVAIGFMLASVAFLTFQNLNIYLAVCRSTSKAYRTFKSTRCCRGIIACVWCTVALFTGASTYQGFYDWVCEEDVRRVIYSKSGRWIPCFTITVSVFIPLVADFFFLMNLHTTYKANVPILSLRQRQERLQALKKAKGISIITILSSIVFFPSILLLEMERLVESLSMAQNTVRDVFLAIYIIFVLFRPVVYYASYRPLWTATREAFCGRQQ